MVERILNRDDLDELSEAAAGAEDPATVAAQLVELATGGHLADPADTGYAYLLAAEIHERSDDLAAALAMIERALDAYRRVGHRDLTGPRDYRARLLLQLGREDEAMRELAELRPAGRGATGRGRNGHVAGPVAASGRGTGNRDDDGVPDEDGLPDDAGVPDDELADGGEDDGELEAADDFTEDLTSGEVADGDGAVLLIWPQDAYEQVDQRWPEVLEPTGAEDWDEYRRYCQALIVSWTSRHREQLYQVTGDPDEFDEWMAEQGADPYHSNLVTLARGYGDYLAEQGDPVELPPAPEDPCWCGSGGSYADCCRPLS